MKTITLATVSLNQFALDFNGNLKRSIESFKRAKLNGASYRLGINSLMSGPELELSGYGCNDHFFEIETVDHCFESLMALMESKETEGIIGDVGMPVVHAGLRPKMFLANDGNYREMRWFSPWAKPKVVQDFYLPPYFARFTGQATVPFGDGIVKTATCSFGTELCEELFTPLSPHLNLSLAGVEVFTNGSASHHEFEKLGRRINLIREATLKCGGVYLYANQQGCDGERVYYDGSSLIIINGQVIAQGSQFSLDDVQVLTATVDLDQVTTYRAAIISRGQQASLSTSYPTSYIPVDFTKSGSKLTGKLDIKCVSPSEEIEYGPACWLWDYLRRSKQNGFFLPLRFHELIASGGIDSCATSLIVFSMCRMVFEKVASNDEAVIADLRAITKNSDFSPKSPQEIGNKLFHTAYMATSNSSEATRGRAKKLSEAIGSFHLDLNIDTVIAAILNVFAVMTGCIPAFGASKVENLALQNVQSRVRMVVAYLFAQLALWSRGTSGSLLVLASANVDETLRGYLTKYDCSSADLNPIGGTQTFNRGISKNDLKLFIQHYSTKPGFEFLSEFIDALPTAELEPITETYSQTDEVDMGMTYDELSTFGRLRKIDNLGPVEIFRKLLNDWSELAPAEVAAKVKKFFYYYGINRHKTTVLSPSYHMSAYSPDDNRFDLRQFLYPDWERQFKKIDEILESID